METTSAEVELASRKYRDNGYVVLRKFFHPSDVERVYDEARDVFANQFIRYGFAGNNRSFIENMVTLFRDHGLVFENCGKQVQHLVNLHRLSLQDRVINLLTKVAGMRWPTICTRPVLYFNHPRLAKKRVYHTVDAHQDWRSMQGSSNAAVLWLPLTDCPIELGPVQFLPGSHVGGLRTREVKDGFGMVELSAKEKSLLVSESDLKRGDAVLFHSMLVHQSGDNRSVEPRWSAHFRYNDLDDEMFIQRGYVHPYIYKPVDNLI
jgi:phytanoyl-CoA hydroxylase